MTRSHDKPAKNLKKIVSLAALTLAAVTIVVTLASREVRFLARSAYEEARILIRRRAIESMIADPATSPEVRAQLQLVLDARAFAADSLSLDVGDAYTTYTDVGRDTLLLVLSASPKDELSYYTWRYPIVGEVPYKGFFHHETARAAAARLETKGYDTHLRPAGAFSTLGWFSDPLLSTAMSPNPVALVATVIHEVSHNTIYVPGATNFNESFALFVGYLGAYRFFQIRGDSSRAERAGAIWRDERRLQDFYGSVRARLDSLYGGALPRDSLMEAREAVFDGARGLLAGRVGNELEVYGGERLAQLPMNNATILAASIYRTRLELFERAYEINKRGLRETVWELSRLVESSEGVDPFTVLEAYAGSHP